MNDVDLDVLPRAVSTGGGRSPVYVADHRGAPEPAVDRSPPFSRRPVVQHARWLVASAGPSGYSRCRSSSGCCVCVRKLLAVVSRPRRAAPMGWPRGGCPACSSIGWRDLARTIGGRQTIHIICGSSTSAVVRILGGASSEHEHLRRLALTAGRPPVSRARGLTSRCSRRAAPMLCQDRARSGRNEFPNSALAAERDDVRPHDQATVQGQALEGVSSAR